MRNAEDCDGQCMWVAGVCAQCGRDVEPPVIKGEPDMADNSATPALPPNPKQIFGDKKPPLAYIPLSGQLAELEALYDGMLKYGPLNWREQPVEIMTYVEAAARHLQLFKVGEAITRDTLVQNLGAVKACCSIIIDAMAHGTAIDNRPISQIEADLLYAGEEWVARLKQKQQERAKVSAEEAFELAKSQFKPTH